VSAPPPLDWTQIVADLDVAIAAWEAADAEDKRARHERGADRALLGQAWIVHAGSYAYNVVGNTCVPVPLIPSLVGVMRYSRTDAQQIAKLREHDCQISHQLDLRAWCVAGLRATRGWVLEHLAAAIPPTADLGGGENE
jgi:hypothetical protein